MRAQALNKSSGTVKKAHGFREAQNFRSMCNLSPHIILSEIPTGQISWCRGCKTYSFIYNSYCLSVSREQLIRFREVLMSLSEEDFIYNFFGRRQVLLRNQYACSGICLCPNEVTLIARMIQEALTINEIFELVYN